MAGKKLSASLEDYLEAIFEIEAEKQAARSKDISDRTHVSRSSVTGALRSLADKGLVNYEPYDLITLTPEGRAVAKGIVRRHKVLEDFFVNVLGVGERESEETACKMEHAMSGQMLERFVRFVDSVEAGGRRPQGRGGRRKPRE